MPVDAYGPDIWLITHPGLSRNPADYGLGIRDKSVEKPKTDVYQLSYEFVDFLRKWEMGDYGPSEFHTRNFLTATRKSCFPEPLMNQLGMWTETGEKALARAKSYKQQVDRYYLGTGLQPSQIPQWRDCDKMDTIIVAAVIQAKHVIFLKELYFQENPEVGPIPTQFGSRMPKDVQFEYRVHEGRTYAMTVALRDYPQRRKDFEFMVRLGLIGLEQLPKPLTLRGRGRAPVGAYLTEPGKLFFEDFQFRYDPEIKRRIELHQMMDSDISPANSPHRL